MRSGPDPDQQMPDAPSTFDGAPVLQRSRSHWQLGDWASLASLDDDLLKDRPDRAKLALLAAAGHGQMGHPDAMAHCLQRALDWGCDRDLVVRVMISGLSNSLGRASLMLRDEAAAQEHFIDALRAVTPDADIELLARARGVQERVALGLLPRALALSDASAQAARDRPTLERLTSLSQQQQMLRAAIAGPLLSTRSLRDAVIPPEGRAAQALAECLAADGDVMLAIDATARDLSPVEQAQLHIAVADHFHDDDPLMVIDALTSAASVLPSGHPEVRLALTHRLLAMNLTDVALRGLVQDMTGAPGLFSAEEQAKLLAALAGGRTAETGHGHVLLIHYLQGTGAAHLKPGQTVVEIGTTRENVPGQGSTAVLGQLCFDLGLQFTTVDMDPFNTARAAQLFARNGWPFDAVTAKGEDYLAQRKGKLDHVFLDAYDFDHGKHSERRQDRYETYLGARIDEQQCHQMHLDCAISLSKSLSAHGTICIDDTWTDDSGNWTAKGTTAVPYLLDNGFEVVEARNNAVILCRKKKPKKTRR